VLQNSPPEHIPGFKCRATTGYPETIPECTNNHAIGNFAGSSDSAAYVQSICLILLKVVGAHLSCKISPNGSEAAGDPRVERDAIHGIKPNSVSRDEGHDTFGSTCIISRLDQLVCH
jgi:hypothetical protein